MMLFLVFPPPLVLVSKRYYYLGLGSSTLCSGARASCAAVGFELQAVSTQPKAQMPEALASWDTYA